MKKLFEKEVFNTDVNIDIITEKSKPKILKGINKFHTLKRRDKSLQLFIDEDYNLWYKDNTVIIGYDSKIIDNKVKTSISYIKAWFKITGLYERKDQFIMNTVYEVSAVSEALYTENTISDNVALEDIYEGILTAYYKHLKQEM